MAIPDYLPQLNEAVARIIAEPNTPGLILALKEELKQTSGGICMGDARFGEDPRKSA